MKRIILLLVAGFFLLGYPTVNAQSDAGGAKEKDYFLLKRFEGSEKVYENTLKWDKFNLPAISADNYLHWEEYTMLEGKGIRYQYKTSPENNDAFVLRYYKTEFASSGFTILYSGSTEEMGIPSQEFDDKYNGILGNKKLGFAYGGRGCNTHSFIVGKIIKDGKTIFATVYMASFNNATIITQDIFEAETIKEHKVIVTLYRGSYVAYDDKIGFDEFYVTTAISDSGILTTKNIEGNIHHRFCYVPAGNTVNQIIKNYEAAIKSKGGKILVSSSGKAFYEEFHKKRPDHGNTNYEWLQFGLYNYYYLSAFIPGNKFDYYVLVLPAQVENKLVYSLVIIETKPMEIGLVSAENIDNDILSKGHIAIYGIHFETGKSVVKSESKESLKSIAAYLNNNTDKKFYIVGHTDNTGDFAANKILSEERAKSVINELETNFNVNSAQLEAYGVSSLAPLVSNKTDEGKAKNRRVEIVEQ